MKRISSLIACGVIALGFATSANAQTRTSQLIITNSNGTAKVSMLGSSLGVCMDQYLTLCRPGNPLSTITLIPPSTNGARNFSFPETGGEILTDNSSINATQITDLDTYIENNMGSFAGDQTINVTELNGDYTFGLNLNNANIWTATQTFPLTINQGNALINSINMGNIALTGYATTSDITNLQTSITNLTNASANFLEVGDIAVTSPLTATPGVGSVTLGMSNSGVTAGSYTNANITVDAFGRVTAAANGSGSLSGNIQLTPSTEAPANNNNNNDLVIGSNRYFRVSGTTDFGYRSLTTGTDGQMVVIYNTSAFNMSMANDLTGIPSGHSKILTNLPTSGGTGDNLITSGPGVATLIYDSAVNAWVVTSFIQ